MCELERIQSHGPSKCISALGSWPKSGCTTVAETVPALSGCGNARNRAEECRSALANARVGHQPASQKPSGGATVRAPAAACTRAPSRPNARTRDDARPTHLCRAMSPASSHTPPSSVSSTDIGKDFEHKVSACDHGCAPQHAPHSTLPDWVAPPQATRCPAAAQLVCHRCREHALSPRPVHLPRPAYRPRTPA